MKKSNRDLLCYFSATPTPETSENGNISESLDFLDDLPEQPRPNLKRKRSNIEASEESFKNLGPRPSKIQREQVQVGVVRNLRNQPFLVPETLPLSIDKTLHCDDLTAHKSTKKPNGRGYSKGNYGEKSVYTIAIIIFVSDYQPPTSLQEQTIMETGYNTAHS